MAFLHRTWAFDPVAAHDRIAAHVVDGDSLNRSRLLELARETVSQADAVTAHYLEMVRYDESWLTDDEELDEAHL